jgi:hypothetical protein
MSGFRLTQLFTMAVCGALLCAWVAARGRLLDLDQGISITMGDEDVWARLARLKHEGRELDGFVEITKVGFKTREAAIVDLIAGRLTLRQAAARFLAADAGLPAQMTQAKLAQFPGGSNQERACRWVLAYLEDGARTADSSGALAIISRLEAELASGEPLQ